MIEQIRYSTYHTSISYLYLGESFKTSGISLFVQAELYKSLKATKK